MTIQRSVGYDNVDNGEGAEHARLIGDLDEQGRFRSTRLIRQLMVDLLDIQPGSAILDIGSGTGDDTRNLARLAGPGGKVIGIDTSAVMVAEAQHRAKNDRVQVTFQIGDVQDLAFPDATFDRVWSERTFIWLHDPYRAFQEVLRVTRPGGRIVISTYDMKTPIFGGFEPALNQRLERWTGAGIPSPRIGRELASLLRAAGLEDIVVRPHLVEMEAPTSSGFVGWIVRHRTNFALDAGAFTEAEAARYLQSFEEAIEAGVFFNVLIAFIVAGTKPGTC